MMLRMLLLAGIVALGAFAAPAALSAQSSETGPDTTIITAKRGDVTFTHGKHAGMTKCVACHHESRPEKPLPADAPKQSCSACHTNPAAEPMKTSGRNAMHDTGARTGICYSCHIKEAEAGKTTPGKCADCHTQAK